MKANDIKELKDAVDLLENPSFIAQLTNLLGSPIDWAMKRLPEAAGVFISKAVNKSIHGALKAAVFTMGNKKSSPSPWWHRLAVSASGALGGFFSWPGMAIELPFTTIMMLRSIADIGRGEGEEIETVDSQLACVMVFALGGNRSADDSAESGYYAARIALADALVEAAEFIAKKGIIEEGSPVIVRFIAKIAARFEVVVSEKAVAEAIPVVGAVSGAAINVFFINHFQNMAKGHFVVRRLERKYGETAVRDEYQAILCKQYKEMRSGS